MTQIPKERRGRGRPPLHDPDVVKSFLAEREATGESLSSLSARSGMPAGTLAYRSRQMEQLPSEHQEFVEIAIEEACTARVAHSCPSIIVQAQSGSREIVVPHGFDAYELRRLIETLEESC